MYGTSRGWLPCSLALKTGLGVSKNSGVAGVQHLPGVGTDLAGDGALQAPDGYYRILGRIDPRNHEYRMALIHSLPDKRHLRP